MSVGSAAYLLSIRMLPRRLRGRGALLPLSGSAAANGVPHSAKQSEWPRLCAAPLRARRALLLVRRAAGRGCSVALRAAGGPRRVQQALQLLLQRTRQLLLHRRRPARRAAAARARATPAIAGAADAVVRAAAAGAGAAEGACPHGLDNLWASRERGSESGRCRAGGGSARVNQAHEQRAFTAARRREAAARPCPPRPCPARAPVRRPRPRPPLPRPRTSAPGRPHLLQAAEAAPQAAQPAELGQQLRPAAGAARERRAAGAGGAARVNCAEVLDRAVQLKVGHEAAVVADARAAARIDPAWWAGRRRPGGGARRGGAVGRGGAGLQQGVPSELRRSQRACEQGAPPLRAARAAPGSCEGRRGAERGWRAAWVTPCCAPAARRVRAAGAWEGPRGARRGAHLLLRSQFSMAGRS
jgi:hypothetical protein